MEKVLIINLTHDQKEKLKSLYNKVEKATTKKEYGSIIAQVGLHSLEVCFLPYQQACDIIDIINKQYPEGFKKTKG